MNTSNTTPSNSQMGLQPANPATSPANDLQIAASDLQFAAIPPTPPLPLHPANTLNRLTRQQLDQLYDWLLTSDLPTAQKNCLEQFQHHICITSLCRYRARRKKHERVYQAIQSGLRTPEQLHQNAHTNFALVLNETTEDAADPQDFARLATWFAKHEYNQTQRQFLDVAQQQTQIARDRLALQTRAFEFNAARQVLIHFHKVREILDDPDIDNQEKIERTRGLIFPQALPTKNP